jgi:PleD family two-component response regulator
MQATPRETSYSNAVTAIGPAGGAPTPEAAGQIIPLKAAEFHPPRVLVVDDEGLLRWSLSEMLLAAGYETVQARDGREARLAFADDAHPIDVVLLDLNPGRRR